MNRAIDGNVEFEEYEIVETSSTEHLLRGFGQAWSGNFSKAYGVKMDADDSSCLLLLSARGERPNVRVTQLSGHSYVVVFGEDTQVEEAAYADKLLKVLDGMRSAPIEFLHEQDFDASLDKLRSKVRRRHIFKF
jgi:hypothetical protein